MLKHARESWLRSSSEEVRVKEQRGPQFEDNNEAKKDEKEQHIAMEILEEKEPRKA